MSAARHPAAVAPRPTIVCFPFVGDRVGGSHLSALGLIHNLDRSRYQALVVLDQTEGPLATLLAREGVPFVQGPRLTLHRSVGRARNAIRAVSSLPSIVRFIKANGVGIVHSNDGRVHASWGIAARLAGARLVWHHRGDPTSFALRRIAPFVADHILAVSGFALPEAITSRPGLRSSVVRSPFDTSAAFDRSVSRAALLAEVGLPADTLVLGYVGTLVERKRPLLFVDVVAELRRLDPALPVVGVLLGSTLNDMDEKVAERVAQRGVHDHVINLGFRSPGDFWIAALDALLITAVDEPFGRTLVEAMLNGTLVIATRSGGNPEAIEEGRTGVLVPPDDATAFAEAVLSVRSDPAAWTRMVEAGREEAGQRFGIRHHVDAVTAVYDDLENRRSD